MNLYELLERLGLDPDRIYDGNEKILEADIDIHFQETYPLKGPLKNVRMLDGRVVFAAGAGTEYGSNRAWEEGDDDDMEVSNDEG